MLGVELRLGIRQVTRDQLVLDAYRLHRERLVVGERAAELPVRQKQQVFGELLCKSQLYKPSTVAERQPHARCQMRHRPHRLPAPRFVSKCKRPSNETIHLRRSGRRHDFKVARLPVDRCHER